MGHTGNMVCGSKGSFSSLFSPFKCKWPSPDLGHSPLTLTLLILTQRFWDSSVSLLFIGCLHSSGLNAHFSQCNKGYLLHNPSHDMELMKFLWLQSVSSDCESVPLHLLYLVHFALS